MVGNAQGWVIAALVLLAEAGAVSYALSLDATSPPTAAATTPGAMDVLKLPVDPQTVVSLNAAGDAGKLYRQAAGDYLDQVSLYENFIRDRDRAQIPKLAALQPLIDATHLRGGVIYANEPSDIVVYGESNTVQALKQVGIAAINAGLLAERRDPTRAKALYEAAFSLGMRLFDERLSYREMSAGIEVMSTAGACLIDQAKKMGRADDAARIQTFTDAQRDYARDVLVPRFEAIYSMNEKKIAEHNGDVFYFVKNSHERVWRVEALLKLGRMRFNVGEGGTPGDQRHAARLATRYAELEDDAVVRRAATLARDLTIDQFRTLH